MGSGFFSRLTGKGGKSGKLDSQIKKYLEFYYPTTGQITYNIVYKWGEYIITTHDKLNTKVHEDSKPYLGYITHRPIVTKPDPNNKPKTYLITPQGAVWEHTGTTEIPERNHRVEETVEKHEHSTSTKTLTIESVSEPVIDHFLVNKAEWHQLGQLEVKGDKTKLILID